MKRIEDHMETAIFASRWLLAPFFLGLLVCIVVLLVKFFKELGYLVWNLATPSEYDTVISVLTLVDTTLIAVLLLIIVFSGYENFVSKIGGTSGHEDRPVWMGKVGFADLKIKLIGAIVAISAVELLKAFLVSTQFTNEQLTWKVVIHLTFVFSGVMFAVTDWIVEHTKRPKSPGSVAAGKDAEPTLGNK